MCTVWGRNAAADGATGAPPAGDAVWGAVAGGATLPSTTVPRTGVPITTSAAVGAPHREHDV